MTARGIGALVVAVLVVGALVASTPAGAAPSVWAAPSVPAAPSVAAAPSAPAAPSGSVHAANFIDPALANTGGPPAPPAPGVALTGGSFPEHGLLFYGDAAALGTPASEGEPAVAMARTPDGHGYWITAADGAVAAFGDAQSFGGASTVPLQAPIIGMATTPDGLGYWLVALDGGIFGFGSAHFWGSMGGTHLNQPIVGMASTPDGGGYWLAAADGGIFAFGDARFWGSMGGTHLYAPVVGIAVTPGGAGYWEVASDGGVFRFGDASFHGSLGATPIDSSVVGLASTPDGQGYWMAEDDGTVIAFGDATFHGDDRSAVPTPMVSAIVATADGGGYWLLAPGTIPTSFAPTAIVRAAASQLGGNRSPGYFCNPYGPCEEWCALFATWAWAQGGIPIPRYGFTGDIYTWAAAHGAVLPASAHAAPGDAVLYGTGPATAGSSLHVGLVGQVWPDGAVVTLDGDAGPGPPGSANVIVNGPFLPTDSHAYNGFGIYAFAVP